MENTKNTRQWSKPEIVAEMPLSNTLGGTLTSFNETQTFPTTGGGTVRGTVAPSGS